VLRATAGMPRWQWRREHADGKLHEAEKRSSARHGPLSTAAGRRIDDFERSWCSRTLIELPAVPMIAGHEAHI